jgi:predicted PurR-regulated permease PerM
MRNLNWTRLLTVLLTLLALYALLAVVGTFIARFSLPLLLLIFGSIVAFVLMPIVNFIQSRSRIFRGGAILITYLGIIVVVGTLGYFMSVPLIAQTKHLADVTHPPTHLKNVNDLRANIQLELRRASAMRSAASSQPGNPCFAFSFVGTRTEIRRAVSRNLNVHPQDPSVVPNLCSSTKATEPTLLHLVSIINHGTGQLNHPVSTHAGKDGKEAPNASTSVPNRWTTPVDARTKALRQTTDRSVAKLGSQGGPNVQLLQRLANQVRKLSKKDLSAVQHVRSILTSTPIGVVALQNSIDQHGLPIDLHVVLGKALAQISTQGTTILDNAVSILTGTVNIIFDLVVVLIISVYLLADGGRFIGWLMGIVPEGRREQVWYFVNSLDRVLGGYIRGQLIVAITVGILAGVGCYALGVPYALLIGIFALIAESIPVFGPVIASIPAILVALFSVPLLNKFLVVAWFIVIQQVEQNVVGPRITGRAVGIHPVVAMVAILIGVESAGIIGAFLAVPIAGLLQVVSREVYRVIILQRPMQTATVPDTVEVTGVEDSD